MNRNVFEILVIAILIIGFGTITFSQNRGRFCPSVDQFGTPAVQSHSHDDPDVDHDHPPVDQEQSEPTE